MPENDRHLLIGVTGGIATGKSTVAHMLKEKGAYIIDYDILSREAVEPDQPAWIDILDFFGKQVLQEDRSLDRKKLSDIVFSDMEKRKKLENFTHPRIHDLFEAKLREILAPDPDAIVQAVMPLLIEINMLHRFHKNLLVYVPREIQIERLMKRDGIFEEQAENILKAQMPIDEKVGYCDFVINNEGTQDETRTQVNDLWEKLQTIQKTKKEK